MGKVVLFGAGQNGLGLIGRLLSSAGYELSFVDKNQERLSQIKGGYEVNVVSPERPTETVGVEVDKVFSTSDNEFSDIVDTINESEFVVTSLGYKRLPNIVRYLNGARSDLEVLCCENHPEAADRLSKLIDLHGRQVKIMDSIIHAMSAWEDGQIVSESYSETDILIGSYSDIGKDYGFSFTPISAAEIPMYRDVQMYIQNLMHIALAVSSRKASTLKEAAEDENAKNLAKQVTDLSCKVLAWQYQDEARKDFNASYLRYLRDSFYSRASNFPGKIETFRRNLSSKLSAKERIIWPGLQYMQYNEAEGTDPLDLDIDTFARLTAMTLRTVPRPSSLSDDEFVFYATGLGEKRPLDKKLAKKVTEFYQMSDAELYGS